MRRGGAVVATSSARKKTQTQTCGAQSPRSQLFTRPHETGHVRGPLFSPRNFPLPEASRPLLLRYSLSPPPPSRTFHRRSGKGMAMATQTGFAASKVLILVGAGPSLAVTIVCSAAPLKSLSPSGRGCFRLADVPCPDVVTCYLCRDDGLDPAAKWTFV
jgi:hypothetical protein